MKAGRTSIGSRIISMLLVVVMVLGMVPFSAFRVSAATQTDSVTTQTSVDNVRRYANGLLSEGNFSINREETHDKTVHYSWTAEEKPDNWRYFNGVMMEAFLMLGAEGSGSGNALNFVKQFFDTNINDDGTIDKFLSGELDSVPPARTLAHLMGTGLQGKGYAEALKFVYDKLKGQKSYADCGGNFWHKETTDTNSCWYTFNIGLDGLYMAQPFLMEYADLLDKGLITDSSTTANEIRTAVYDRFVWVADTMYDKTSHLYHHGWNVAKGEGNGAFWGRGIGWYAAALVDVIELMPAGEQKETLKTKLIPLFDGMMEYRDPDTGLWYNVVNKDGTYCATGENILETSGSALMAYALMKAYNNGYVTDKKYGEAGLNAFNNIAATKLVNGVIEGTYKQSGVETITEGYGDKTSVTYPYTKYDFVADEAKGVGPVLMAASIANTTAAKLEGQSAPAPVVTAGVVHAADNITVAVGETSFHGVTATVIDNMGTIKEVSWASGLKFTMGNVENGKATVTAAYQYKETDPKVEVGTFEVTVVDPSKPASASGTITTTDGTATPTNQYNRVTSLTAGKNYVITKSGTGSTVNAANVVNGQIATEGVTGTNSTNADGSYTLEGMSSLWTLDSSGKLYTVQGETTYYLEITGTSSSNRQATTDANAASIFTFTKNGEGVSMSTTVSDKTAYIKIDSGGFRPNGQSTDSVYVYEQISTSQSKKQVNLSVTPNTVNVQTGETGNTANLTTTVTVDGQAVTEYTLTWKTETGKENVATAAGSVVTAGSTAGTAKLTATLSQVKVDGKLTDLDNAISVDVTANVKDGTTPVEPAKEIAFTLNTDNMGTPIKFYKGETVDIAIDTVTEDGKSVSTSGYALQLTSANTEKLTVSGTTVTAAGKTSGTKVTVDLVKDNKVVVTKTVTFAVLNKPVVQIDTSSCGTAPTMKVGEDLNLSTVAMELAHGETITWSSSDDTVATVTNEGVVHGVKEGTATITATLTPAAATQAAEPDPNTVATIEVTVTAADTAATGNVTITVPGTTPDKTAHDFQATGFVKVKDAVPGTQTTTYSYTKITTLAGIENNTQYVIVDAVGEQVALKNNNGKANATGSITDTWKFDNAEADATGSHWTFTGSGSDWKISNGNYSFYNDGKVMTTGKNLVSTVSVDSNGKFKIVLDSGTPTRYLRYSGTEWTRSDSNGTDATEVLLFKVTATPTGSSGTPAVWGKLTCKVDPGKGFAYEVNTKTAADVKTAIQEGFTVTAAEDEAGTKNAATVAMTNTDRITIDTSATYLKMDTAGDYKVPVKLDGVEIGTVPVKVYAAATADQTHSFDVTMPTVAGVTVEVGKNLTVAVDKKPTAVVAGTTTTATVGDYTLTWSSEDSTVATVDAATGKITGVKAGSTNVTGKLTKITIDDLTAEDAQIADSLTVTVPVTVNDATPVPAGSYTYVLDTDGIDPGKEYLIVAKTADGQYYALKNVTTKVGSSTDADKLLLDVNAGNDKIITIANESDALLSEWYFSGASGAVNITNTHNTNTNPVYVNIGNAKILNTSSQAYLTAVNEAAGTYHIAKSSSGSKMVFNGTIFTRGDTAQDLYLYKKQVNTSEISVKPSSVTLNLFDETTLTPTVMYKGKTLDNYELSWTLDLEDTKVVTVATSDETNKIRAKATLTANYPGNANVIVKLLKADGIDVSGDNITATVPVTVEALTMTLSQETLGLYIDKAFTADQGTMHKSLLKEKDLEAYVASGEVTQTNVTIAWSCTKNGDVEVVTVENGKVVAKTLGTSTVTAKLTEFNGKPLPEGLEVSKSCVVTVAENDVKEVALNPTAVAVGWKKANESTKDQQKKIDDALDAINVTITYHDGFSKTISLGYLRTRATGVTIDTSAIDLSLQEAKDYTVNVHIDGAYHDYDRNVRVSIVDPSLLNADGIIKEELTLKYQLAKQIQDGKEYIIVAFPTDTDKTNGTGIALSNDNATNDDPAQPLAVNVTVENDPNNEGFVTIKADGRNNDTLMKWYFSAQTSGNWYIYNLQHRLTANDKLLQGRYDTSNDENRLYAKFDEATDAFFLSTEDPNTPGKHNYVTYSSSAWKHAGKDNPGDQQRLYLYERVTTTKDVPVRLEVSPQAPINLHEGMSGQAYASVFVGTDPATQWNVLWSSADETIATVDPNTGKITPASPTKAGEVKINATLYAANNMEVLSSKGAVTKSVTVNVSAKQVSYMVNVGDVQDGTVTTRLGGRPDYSTVRVVRKCEDHGDAYILLSDPDVELDPLSAVDPTTKAAKPLNLTQPGDYKVPVYHQKKEIGSVTVTVSDDPYLGLNQTNAYPEYPDAGGIRIQKFGTGGKKYLDTGLANVELRVAGVSGKSNVDVVLVVDVSNSMAWSMDWFEGLTKDQVLAAKDPAKIPDTAGEKDKLDLAMEYAQSFADTLLGNGKSGNTLSFVTFAGNDTDNRADDGSSTTYGDSVKTVFTSVSNAADAKASFAGTKFTQKTASGDKVECRLTIAGTDGQGLENADNQINRGNTNYDYAFGQAMDAVAKIKDNYQKDPDNNGKSYEDSGREIHVVFMTDGAPSHYNGIWNKKLGTGDLVYATLWGDATKNRYTAKEYTNADWLTYIGWYNTLATQLYSQITDMHIVGFDLEHGGYTGFSSDAPSLNKVLQGLVQNRVLESVQADDTATLKKFFDDLAANLTYSATNAKVTDLIGEDFELFTGIQGDDVTQKEPATITVKSYDLWKKSDVGTGEGQCSEAMVGERKDAEGKELETVTFNTAIVDGKCIIQSVTSTEIGEVPVTTDASGNVIKAEAKYFTYDITTYDSKTYSAFTWNIGNVEDKEYTLTYLAYLKLSRDGGNDNNPAEGLHDTNKVATLDYVDMNGRLAHRVFPVPQLPWQEVNIGVRFFLVDKDGNYVNHAGHKFDDKANRVFLSTRKYYSYKLTQAEPYVVSANDAFAAVQNELGGAANYILYDPVKNGEVSIKHDATGNNLGYATITGNDTKNLITAFDLVSESETTGNFLHTIVDIPVVLNDYGTAESPLTADAVVMDFGLPMPIDVITNDTGRKAINQQNNRVLVKMSVMGFVPYAEGKELKNYIGEYDVEESLTGEYGTFTRVDGQVRYTPGKILTGLEKVFVAVKLEPSEGQTNTEDFRILLNPLTIVPATVMSYETDDNMAPAFTYSGLWYSDGTQSYDLQDAYTPGEVYGFDSSYKKDITNSNKSSKWVEGIDPTTTKVSFDFTGTGFDIISRTGKEQGTIRVQITGKDNYSKTISVINKGDRELYQIPVISVEDLPYGEYTVEIGVLRKQQYGKIFYIGNQFFFDAVRIYGTMAGNETQAVPATIAKKNEDGTITSTIVNTVQDLYTADGEANTKFEEIRKSLVSAESFGKYEGDGTLFFDGMGTDVTPANYAAKGPNNEVYLAATNAIAFSFDIQTANSTLDLGMKSVDGKEVTAEVTVVKNGVPYPTQQILIESGTAMFYDLLKNITDAETGIVQVVVKNAGPGILSLTDLKSNGGEFAYSADTLKAASHALNQKYVIEAQFKEKTVRVAGEVTLEVSTEAWVTELVVTNSSGAEVNIQCKCTNPDATEGQKQWTVILRPTLLGEQSYNVYGLREENTQTTYGDAVEAKVNVTLY